MQKVRNNLEIKQNILD